MRPASATGGPQRLAAGLAARRRAVDLIHGVLADRRALEEAGGGDVALDVRDAAFARRLALTVLRRHGELSAVLDTFIARRPEGAGRLQSILLAGAAQLLCLETPPHAAISLAVDHCRLDRRARRFAGLTNAVLRKVATQGPKLVAAMDGAPLNVPPWMLQRWERAYGREVAREIARASLVEAALDITARDDPVECAALVGGVALSRSSIRLVAHGRVDQIAGFAEGTWWVQDAAAALPARLLGDVRGKRVADLCAAPGGKTMQLAAAGAVVTAIDQSAERLQRVEANLKRTRLSAKLVTAPVESLPDSEPFDAALLDAPCTTTGTIRRHPDILHLKRADDVSKLAAIQQRLLDKAVRLVKPGGVLVYCSCSLEPEEGGEQARRLLASGLVDPLPATAAEIEVAPECVTPEGWLRTLPCHPAAPGSAHVGLDGFFAARFRRK